MTLELRKLRAIAEAATPGRWLHVNHGDYIELDPRDENYLEGPTLLGSRDKNKTNNAEFISAFNPATALELLDLLEKAREFAAFVMYHSAANTYNNEAAKEILALLGQKGSGE